MFTHETPELRYVLDPQGVSPHLRKQATPDSSHCGHRTRLHTPPPQTAARSLFTRNRVGEGAPRQSTGTQRRRRGCSECLCPLCCRSRTPVRSPTRPPAPAQCHCLSLWENGGDGGGGRGGGGGGGGGGGKCTGPARPAPQGQRGRG
ncbi:protein FAM98B-like [Rhinopithecus roxellana]|uniref:protein FAM98B-like n=1 Tax=Rhinopithecus roxellana TaxID=61622 RepID=UPI0012377623|nr:protein FAM98B-like [Rhinopithecus roxellana]